MKAGATDAAGTRSPIPAEFWPAMAKAMADREWPSIPVSDFPVGSVRPNYWLCGMIDGHQKSVDGALGELFAATHALHFPNYRLLVVAYQTISKAEIEALLVKHLGTRMDKQAIVGVIPRESGGKLLHADRGLLGLGTVSGLRSHGGETPSEIIPP